MADKVVDKSFLMNEQMKLFWANKIAPHLVSVAGSLPGMFLGSGARRMMLITNGLVNLVSTLVHEIRVSKPEPKPVITEEDARKTLKCDTNERYANYDPTPAEIKQEIARLEKDSSWQYQEDMRKSGLQAMFIGVLALSTMVMGAAWYVGYTTGLSVLGLAIVSIAANKLLDMAHQALVERKYDQHMLTAIFTALSIGVNAAINLVLPGFLAARGFMSAAVVSYARWSFLMPTSIAAETLNHAMKYDTVGEDFKIAGEIAELDRQKAADTEMPKARI